MITTKCDKCGAEVKGEKGKGVQYTYPLGWERLKFNISYSRVLEFHICDKCKVGMKLPIVEVTPGIEDRLFEILSDMVNDAVESYQP